ncbi:MULTISPECIES: flagellar basal body rod protein FlgB [Piscirickettsiaceae]|jgi:flagellar basal-body rod protein FlgB|uniref:Flagellar basal body rod protein FlgB n=1 Tax=Hydrogenovibrio thermophilus TaxID=265883 RepID=A0A410H3T6_9GAMM|nr:MULTISPECIES: flagellar basal body rod protein FlgB [Piscirickettsiaceae]AZR81870.1 flagellar biosynthesis protein FlgB [Thiomicrospira sp. S5]QAB15598.1 flagellar basal body rod protein FlgB [Hydrogenovibrio thermophilus]
MESVFGIHEQALAVRKERQGILANNLANADTPNFKARDLDWRKELQTAEEDMQTSRYKPDLKVTNSRHIEGFAEASTDDFLKYRMPTQPSLDGNTVETHIEKAQFMENAMQYQATLEFVNSKISSIRGALRGE